MEPNITPLYLIMPFEVTAVPEPLVEVGLFPSSAGSQAAQKHIDTQVSSTRLKLN